jgi:nicotinate-nucleotide pyrophosphorylase (carboxylating)
MRVAPFASLDPASYREIVRRALAEDVRWGDATTDAVVDAEHTATGAIVVRASCVVAGLDVAMECFRQLDPHVQVEAARREGEHCESGTDLIWLRGGVMVAMGRSLWVTSATG